MTDQQLMLLEVLTYEKRCYSCQSVEEFLLDYNDDRLKTMEESGDQNARDRAAAIRAMQQDDSIKKLTINQTSKDHGVLVLNDPNEPDRGYVLFQGTKDSREWYDDAVGLYVTDTPVQQQTLEYIQSLDYEKLTVTGHSKGGNKAMYVTILDDRVDRCVSMSVTGDGSD